MMAFNDVVSYLQKKKRPMSLLIGNGFSMAYDKDIFSYNALYTFLNSQNDDRINKLFGVIKTKNFELVMRQLDTTIALLKAFGAEPVLQEQIRAASQHLKDCLLKSVKGLHPEHVYKMPEERASACAQFLSLFLDSGGHIYSTNYDLLLYWVLMRKRVGNAIDGFGRELLNPVEAREGEEKQWSDILWGPNQADQNIHYLHGALHLFDLGYEVVKEQYDQGKYLLEKIEARLEAGNYPIFVTAGNGDEKLEHIRHNRYLSTCYDRLCAADGSIVTFGFNFGPYDEHIIEAINKAAKFDSKQPPKLWSIYVGVYSEEDALHMESIKGKFHPKLHLFNAKTANIWES